MSGREISAFHVLLPTQRSHKSRSAIAERRVSLRDIWCMRWLMGLLALTMVLGPTLGQMHRAVHAGAVSKGSPHVAHLVGHALQAAASVATGAASGAGSSDCAADTAALSSSCGQGAWVHALFAGHGPADCQLLDQASHALAGPPAVLEFAGVAPEVAQPQSRPSAPHSIFIAASFDARAPPLHSHRA